MIEGLKVTIPGKIVQELLEQKAAHHDSRTKFYRDQEEKLKAAGIETAPEHAKFSSSNNANPVKEAQDSVTRHENNAREARFLAKHVDVGERFLLSSTDLVNLGVLRSRY